MFGTLITLLLLITGTGISASDESNTPPTAKIKQQPERPASSMGTRHDQPAKKQQPQRKEESQTQKIATMNRKLAIARENISTLFSKQFEKDKTIADLTNKIHVEKTTREDLEKSLLDVTARLACLEKRFEDSKTHVNSSWQQQPPLYPLPPYHMQPPQALIYGQFPAHAYHNPNQEQYLMPRPYRRPNLNIMIPQ